MADSVQAEIALDLVEGELAAELPAHVRAFARAHAEGRSPPNAPLVARLASTLDAARAAVAHDELADRGLALLRLVAPLAIECEPAVVEARGVAVTWPNLARLAAARDAASRARFGRGAIELYHRLHGVHRLDTTPPSEPGPDDPTDVGAPIFGWTERDVTIDGAAIDDAWQAIAMRLGVAGTVRIDRAYGAARPRTFSVDPRVEVIVVVPAVIDTPAARFAVLHELGHAAAALALPAGIPRVVDEAAASYVGRLVEPQSTWLAPKWSSEFALGARARRRAIAHKLDAIERALPELPADRSGEVPWALWHDPGAQAAYVAAEGYADRLLAELGPNPPRGQFARALEAVRGRIDERTHV